MFKIITYTKGQGYAKRGYAPKPEIAARHLLKTGQADMVYAFEKGQDKGHKFGYDLRDGFWTLPASRSYEQKLANYGK